MALTNAEKTSITELAILMFDVAPGTIYMPYLTATYEAVGSSLSALAMVLDDVGPFLQMHPANEPAGVFADEFLAPLGLEDDAGARDFVTGALAMNMSKGQIAFLAWNFLHNLAPSMPQAYQDAKAIMENKAAVAEHYADVLNGAAEDLATLHGVLAGVTADEASVAAVIDALDDTLATGPALSIGHDFVNPGGTAPVNVTGTVDGDDDGGTASGTYSAGDAIIGNGNMNLKLVVRETGDVAAVSVTNVESIYLRGDVFTPGGLVTFDAADWDGVGMVRLEGGQDGLRVAIENLNAGTGVTIGEVTGSFDLDYQIGTGLAVEIDNPGTDESASFMLGAEGDAEAVLGAGGSLTIQGNDGLAGLHVEAGVDATITVTLDEGPVDAGDVTVLAGANADVSVRATESDSVSFGAITVAAGAGSEVSLQVDDVAGDAVLGAIDIEAQASSTLGVIVDGVEGSLSTGAITLAAGATSDIELALRDVAEGITVGNVSATAGAGSPVSAVFTGTMALAGSFAAGSVSLAAATEATLRVEDFAAATLGDVTLSAVGEAVVAATLQDIGGNLMAGNVSISSGDEGVLDLRVDDVGGHATVGNVTVTGGDIADAQVAIMADGNVTAGAIAASVGADARANIGLSAAAGGNMNAGLVSVTAGDSADVDVVAVLQGVLQDAALGSFTSAGLQVLAAQDADVDVRLGQSLVSTNAQDAASLGDLAVGDVSFTAGDNASVNLVVEQTAAIADAEGYADGDFVLGDVAVAVSATTDEGLSGGSDVTLALRKGSDAGAGAGGDFTVGNVSVSGGERADFDVAIEYQASFAEMGDVSVGTLSLAAGDDALSVGARVLVANAMAGSLGNFALAGASILVGDGSDATLDIELSKAAGAADIGNVSLGMLTIEAGEGSEIEADFDVFGVTSATTIGNFAIGNVNVTLGEDSVADLGGLGIPAADLQSAGTFTVGAVSATLAEGAAFEFDPSMHVNTAMGAVTLGAVNLALGAEAAADYAVALSGATVGAVTTGGWTVVAGEQAEAQLVIDVQGNLGAATVGAISLDLAEAAEVTGSVSLGGSDTVAGATFGNVAIAVDDDAAATLTLAVQADDTAGDMRVGDIALSIADLGVTTGDDDELDVGGAITFNVTHAGDDEDTLTLGNVSFDVAGTASSDEIHMHVQTAGDVVIGDIVVQGKGIFILDGEAHLDPTLDLNVSFIDIQAAGDVTLGNIDFSGYENDVVLDLRWVDHGAASITAGAGNDTLYGTTGNNTLAGGDGVDTIDLSDGGVDTVLTANGDSGKTESTIDSIVGFAGGTNGAGDKLDFNLVAGAAGNYVEGTGAASFAAFLGHAEDALNTTVRYFAEVVGSDILVAVNFGSGEADMVIRLVGTTNLASIGFQNFVA